MTSCPFQASWHPLYDDLCVVGRYPASADPNQRRGVDLVDLKKACVVGHFWDPTASQIMVVSCISPEHRQKLRLRHYLGFLYGTY